MYNAWSTQAQTALQPVPTAMLRVGDFAWAPLISSRLSASDSDRTRRPETPRSGLGGKSFRENFLALWLLI